MSRDVPGDDLQKADFLEQTPNRTLSFRPKLTKVNSYSTMVLVDAKAVTFCSTSSVTILLENISP